MFLINILAGTAASRLLSAYLQTVIPRGYPQPVGLENLGEVFQWRGITIFYPRLMLGLDTQPLPDAFLGHVTAKDRTSGKLQMPISSNPQLHLP